MTLDCPHPRHLVKALDYKEVRGDYRYACIGCGQPLTAAEASALLGVTSPPPEQGLKGRLL